MRPDFSLTRRIIREASSCPRLGWFRARDRGKGDREKGAGHEIRDRYGLQVESHALAEFPAGRLIEGKSSDHARRLTRRAIRDGEQVIFKGVFSHNRVVIRADVMERQDDGSWRLWEVKASTNAERFFEDMAVQVYVLRGLGLQVDPGVVVLDRDATIDSPSFFRRYRCRAEVDALLPRIRARIRELKSACRAGARPEMPVMRKCGRCRYRDECWPDLPERPVFDLYQGSGGWHTVDELIRRGVLDLDKLPSNTDLNPMQKRQMKAIRTGRAVVRGNPSGILARKIEYPLFFLDLEAIAPPIPDYRHQKPYDILPFQWSCHVRRKPDSEVEHHEFLWADGGDPRRHVMESLLFLLGRRGSIVAYSNYEWRVINRMAEIFPDLSRPLKSLEKRIVDLLGIIVRCYYHPEFGGSFSIKNVHPAMSRGEGYEGMEISDGLEAVLAYLKLEDDDLSPLERRSIRNDLLAYCRQDTQAMVDIYNVLTEQGGEAEQ